MRRLISAICAGCPLRGCGAAHNSEVTTPLAARASPAPSIDH